MQSGYVRYLHCQSIMMSRTCRYVCCSLTQAVWVEPGIFTTNKEWYNSKRNNRDNIQVGRCLPRPLTGDGPLSYPTWKMEQNKNRLSG